MMSSSLWTSALWWLDRGCGGGVDCDECGGGEVKILVVLWVGMMMIGGCSEVVVRVVVVVTWVLEMMVVEVMVVVRVVVRIVVMVVWVLEMTVVNIQCIYGVLRMK